MLVSLLSSGSLERKSQMEVLDEGLQSLERKSGMENFERLECVEEKPLVAF